MNRLLLFLVFFWALSGSVLCYADYFTEYVWYRVEPEMSRIVISNEHIRGKTAVDNFKSKSAVYEKEGKYLTHDYANPLKREFVRQEILDGHDIKTTITICPPQGQGCGGAAPEINVTVYFDGVKKVDCPFGYVHASGIRILTIVVYAEDQSIRVHWIDDIANEVWNILKIKDDSIIFDGKQLKMASEMTISK